MDPLLGYAAPWCDAQRRASCGRYSVGHGIHSTAAGERISVKREKSAFASLTVLIAFGANVLVAAAKTVAALITGSASMTAEAAHSWADTGNQVFLLVAERKAARKRDEAHPMGYGREAYVWSMIAAFGLFTAGAVVSVMHGIQQLLTPEPAGDYAIAYVVLTVAFVLEGVSFTQAFRQTRKAARELDRNTLEQVLKSSDPTLRAVFAEDGAALRTTKPSRRPS